MQSYHTHCSTLSCSSLVCVSSGQRCAEVLFIFGSGGRSTHILLLSKSRNTAVDKNIIINLIRKQLCGGKKSPH